MTGKSSQPGKTPYSAPPTHRRIWRRIIAGCALLVLGFAVWQLYDVFYGPLPQQGSAQWEEAIKDHSEFVRNSVGMSKDDLRVSWSRQAQALSKMLFVAPEPAATEIRQRLMGLYGSLGDWQSAKKMNLELLKTADPKNQAELKYNLATLDDCIMKADAGDRKEKGETFLTSSADAIEALTASDIGSKSVSLLHLHVLRGDFHATCARFKSAADEYDEAIRLAVPAQPRNPMLDNPGWLAQNAAAHLPSPEATEQWQHFFEVLIKLNDDQYTAAQALMARRNVRGALSDDQFVEYAQEAIEHGGFAHTWELRFNLAEILRGNERFQDAAKHLFELTKMRGNPEMDRRYESMLPMIYGNLALCLTQMGEKKQALEWYSRILSEFPDDQQARYARQAISAFTN